MGNSEGSTIKGGLIISADKTSYIGGEIVTGNIFIQIQEAIPPSKIILGFKGKESTKWSERRGSGKNKHWRNYEGDHHISNFKFQIYALDASQPMRSFTIPFSFKLPDHLPGSFNYSHDRASAFIRYEMRAKLAPMSGKAFLKNKCPIEIKQVAESIHQNIVCEKTAQISTWCCCSKGKIGIKARIAKDYYTPDEIAIVLADINNSLSQLKVKRVKASLIRQVRLNGKETGFSAVMNLNLTNTGHTHFYSETVMQAFSETGIPEGIKSDGSSEKDPLLQGKLLQIALDLTQARDKIIGHFTTKGTIVECGYSLNIEAEMDGSCMCCGDSPSVFSPVMIYPAEYAPAPLPTPPANWNPELIGQVNLAWDQRYEVQPSTK
ncbi:unnamed protein product [Blepharisma stoltei]|uniref:Arrestin C-terminal-like domain-containing protein n=1 Tax=Blepharisma stoltei TaxID=1481888 RepID=A0AAU9IWV1_9CILI|nr:unnamed protein product [Blepharisma stoltei]